MCVQEDIDLLRLSELRHALALQASGLGHWDWDVATDQMFVSERGQRIYGLAPDTGVRTRSDWTRLVRIHPEDHERCHTSFDRFATGDDESHQQEFRVVHGDGHTRWIKCCSVRVREAAGRSVRFAGSLADVHENKLAELALKVSQERYAFADSASDGHTDWIVATDDVYGSPRFMALCGLPPDTVFGTRSEFVKKFPHHPDDRDRVVAQMTAFFQGSTERPEMDMRLLIDGEVRWVHTKGVCTRDENGALTRWTSSMSDITERKRAEESLRRSEERFELAVAASNDGIWEWDIVNDAMFISARAQQFCGIPVGPAVRKRAEWLSTIAYHPDDGKRRMHLLNEYLAGREPAFDGEWRVLHPNGKYRWVRIRGQCLRDPEGRPTRMAGSMSDIDMHKRAEAAVRQTQRLEAMGTLAGGIAHDFNNILGAVLGYGEMALRDAPAGTRLHRDLSNIVVAGERGRSLVDRVLSFARAEVVERSSVHVESAVSEALELLASCIPEQISLETQLKAGRAAMAGDATQVHQIVANLVTNAVHAMPAGGRLQVSLEARPLHEAHIATTGTLAPGPYLVLEIADNGTGIPQEIMDRIFDPFFTTKEAGVGTGLGLSLIHGIVTDIGGAVDVATVRGAGSTFTVFLPQTGEAPERIEVATALPARGRGQKVLIVDDEMPLMNLMVETLADLGYEPHGFNSSKRALDAFRTSPDKFDVVITDQRMPELSGSELIMALRKLHKEIPIVMVSGFLGANVVAQAKKAGATELLKKPTSKRELAGSLARMLSAST